MASSENTDFERRIKASFDSYEAEYNPADWSDMEIRLNTLPAASAGFQWTFSMNIYLALFVSTALFFLIYKASSHSNISGAEVPGHIIVKDASPIPVRTIQGPVQRNYKPLPVAAQEVTPVADSSAPSLSSIQPASSMANGADYRLKAGGQSIRTNVSGTDIKNTGESQASPAVAIPDAPSHIHIYGDMIDPKQGMIYNTKETLGGAPLNAQTSHSAVTWSDADARKNTADSLKAILTPELKTNEGQTSEKKSENKRTHRLFHGKDQAQDQKAANVQDQNKSGQAQQEPVPEPNKDDKAPADMPQQP
jgi:hypothetical protein